MSRRNEHQNELPGLDQIDNGFAEYAEQKGKEIIESIPQLPYPLTRKKDRRLNRLLRSQLRREKPRYSYIKRGLVATAILLLLIITVQASAIKSAIFNYFIRQREESLDFSTRIQPEQDAWNPDTALPTYIPPGYVFAKPEQHKKALSLLYTCPRKKDIRLTIFEMETSIRINSENSVKQERVDLCGVTGYYSIVGGYMQLVWGKSPAYLLEGPASEEEHLLLMAESIASQSKAD